MKKYLLGITVFFLSVFILPHSVSAAVAFDASSKLAPPTSWYNPFGTTTVSLLHTVSGSNRILLVGVNALLSGGGDIVSSVSYAGVPMTLLSKQPRQDTTDEYTYLYYLLSPTTGTNSIIVSLSSSSSTNVDILGASFTGVAQVVPESNSNSSFAPGSTTYSLSVDTLTDNALLAGFVAAQSGGIVSSGTNTTLTQGSGNDNSNMWYSSSPEPLPGTHTLSISAGENMYPMGHIASLAPVGGTSSPSLPQITGSGTVNRLAKFTTGTTTIGDALFSDDGFNTTLTSGNLFMPVSSMIDSITNGALNFGTTNATTMTFGRTGQNMAINSKLGIGTSTPAATLHVVGDIRATFLNLLAGGSGLDTYSSGLLSIGSSTASSINLGRSGVTVTSPGLVKVGSFGTVSNCSSSASPAVCGFAPAGSVAMPTGGSTLVVNTSAVTANSQIFISEDSSLGTRLGITCNTGTGRNYVINARISGTSFTIKSSANPSGNKACLSYFIVN